MASILGLSAFSQGSAAQDKPQASSLNATAQASTLFQQLESPGSQDSAERMLLARGGSDRPVRKYLVKKLPAVITDGSGKNWRTWSSAVRLAGSLKIVEAAPALTKYVGIDEVGDTSIGVFVHLADDPAGTALVQIGDPAVPAIVTALKSAPPSQRFKLYLALALIDSPRAKVAVANHLNREDDPRCHGLLVRIMRYGPT
ncbi:MAG: hypothetical protein WA581_06640 [Candidatus Acidiferrales bacterium]